MNTQSKFGTFSIAGILVATLLVAQALAIGRHSVYLLAFVVGTTPVILVTYLLIRLRTTASLRERCYMSLAAVPAWIIFYVASCGPMIGVAEYFGFEASFDVLYYPIYLVLDRFPQLARPITNYGYFWSGYEGLIR